MLLITAIKFLSMGLIMITLAGGAIATGVLFAGYLMGAARNPEDSEQLFNTTLMAFALIETFVFMGMLVAFIIYIL